MEKNEKKALETFVIVISAFYVMMESEESKRELAVVLRRMREKIMKDLNLNE